MIPLELSPFDLTKKTRLSVIITNNPTDAIIQGVRKKKNLFFINKYSFFYRSSAEGPYIPGTGIFNKRR